MKKTVFLALLLPLFIASCSLFDKKKEVEEITEEVTSPTPEWTSASELQNTENDFVDAFGAYCESYQGGYQEDIRDAFKSAMSASIFSTNQMITDKYHDWRVDNPFADGDAWLTVPVDEVDYLYDFFGDYTSYFADWRNDYAMYGESAALDSLQSDCVEKINEIIDATCQDFIENWRLGED